MIYLKEISMDVAKIFWSGRSQAVRLPKDFRFDTEQVRIRRHGRAVVLEPVAENWDWLSQVTGPVDAAFVAAATEQLQQQQTPGLADIFK